MIAMNTNEFLQKYRKKLSHGIFYKKRPKLICNDGFMMDVQAGHGLYSEPRCDAEWYKSVEIAFPNMDEELLRPYGENVKEWQYNNIFAYVPVTVCDEIIKKHGGINDKALPPYSRWKRVDYDG